MTHTMKRAVALLAAVVLASVWHADAACASTHLLQSQTTEPSSAPENSCSTRSSVPPKVTVLSCGAADVPPQSLVTTPQRASGSAGRASRIVAGVASVARRERAELGD